MNFVIVSIYDSWYNYSININGILFDSDSEMGKTIYDINWDGEFCRQSLINYLLKTYADYDLIAMCEDGDIEILKGPNGE